MRFVGVDLAWSPRHTTAVAVAAREGEGAVLETWADDLLGHEAVDGFVADAVAGGPALVAVDAPLVVPNEEGIRPCDRAVNARFRRYHAGVHPASRSTLGRYGGFEGERLRADLLRRGYEDAVPLPRGRPVRGLFETYPHAAAVALFRLDERLPYKARGRNRPWAVRRTAYRRFQSLLRGLGTAGPPLRIAADLLDRGVDALEAAERKRYEDLLDALLCAYVALYAWHWGAQRCDVFGTVEEGYMVLPRDPRGLDPPRPGGGRARRGTSGSDR